MSANAPSNRGLPNIKSMTGALAADNSRVNRFVDGLLAQVDGLIDAAKIKDWNELGRISMVLSLGAKAYGYQQLHESAERLTKAVREPENELEIKRSLMKVIGNCGRARKP